MINHEQLIALNAMENINFMTSGVIKKGILPIWLLFSLFAMVDY